MTAWCTRGCLLLLVLLTVPPARAAGQGQPPTPATPPGASPPAAAPAPTPAAVDAAPTAAGEPAAEAPAEPAAAAAQPPPPPPPPLPDDEQVPAPPPPPPPAQRYEGQVGGGAAYEDPAYPEDDPAGDDDASGGFELPGFSVRLDPFNWLLDGRLGIELEVAVLEFMTIELVPTLLVNSEPPTIDFDTLDEDISQHSNGLGSLSGTSLGVGFWLEGKAFEGYVLRAIFTNYGYTFRATDAIGRFDRVNRTERRLMGFIGSYSRWKFFTLGGGLGLGYELNQQERCGLDTATVAGGGRRITSDPGANCDGELQLAADRDASSYVDVNGFLHPAYLEARFSLGFVID